MKKRELAKLFLGIAIGSLVFLLVFIITVFSMTEKVEKIAEQIVSICWWSVGAFLISTILTIFFFAADSRSQLKSLVQEGKQSAICPHCHINVTPDCKCCPNCKRKIER